MALATPTHAVAVALVDGSLRSDQLATGNHRGAGGGDDGDAEVMVRNELCSHLDPATNVKRGGEDPWRGSIIEVIK